jgi:type I restriction enzyme S subunit
VAIIRLVDRLMIPAYVVKYLISARAQERIQHRVVDVARANLSLSDIKAITLPLPPLAEQRRIVEEIERRLSVVHALERSVEANLARAERLRQAILKKAFEGHLVPQDPNDEPASVLLERIRSSRKAAKALS